MHVISGNAYYVPEAQMLEFYKLMLHEEQNILYPKDIEHINRLPFNLLEN